MAFQQSTRQPIQRPIREASSDRASSRQHASAVDPLPTEASQTWVLFSPATDTETTTGASSVLGSVSQSQPTPGRSRLSDLGSLQSLERSTHYADSYAQSARLARPVPSPPTGFLDGHAEEDAEEDAELDSLDSHLADFRAVPAVDEQPPRHTTSTLATVNFPAHDGLGSFRLGNPAGMGQAVQEHLYAFEQFNPRRVPKRRRESLELAQAQLQLDPGLTEELERIQRIEAWRWEHSRVLLSEIQKETRRRRGSELSSRRGVRLGDAAASPATSAAGPTVAAAAASDFAQGDVGGEWHDQDDDRHLPDTAGDDDDASEGLLSRITRKFMLEVMGIDDQVLSILFGESLPDVEPETEAMDLSSDLSTTPKASDPLAIVSEALKKDGSFGTAGDSTSSSWQLRMVERIAKELGQFAHHHMAARPAGGAFSTYQRMQQMPLPFAGLPVIPEAVTPPEREVEARPASERRSSRGTEDVIGLTTAAISATTPTLPPFHPTILQAQPISITRPAAPENIRTPPTPAAQAAQTSASATFTQEEWEKDLDISLVFRYLRSRFVSDAAAPSSHGRHAHHAHHGSSASSASNASANAQAQDTAAKAARVRQHHPLVGRVANRQTGERRPPMPAYRNMNVNLAGAGQASTAAAMRHQHGAAASCASQSTRRSARRSSVSSRHSSRHYWDIGGSIGTGSMIASAGPTGSWGEV